MIANNIHRYRDYDKEASKMFSQKMDIIIKDRIQLEQMRLYIRDFNKSARDIENGETVSKTLVIAHQIQGQIKSTRIGSASEEEISLLREA